MEQKDLKIEVVLHRIGKCPVCQKGQMLQGTAGWTCDYFKSLEDKCTFTIFGTYDGYTLTEEDAVQLITIGYTEEHTFTTADGKRFTGKLELKDGKVRVCSNHQYLDGYCPCCGGKIREVSKGYVCENFFIEGKDHCKIWISKKICERTITKEEVEILLKQGYTEVLDGFYAQGKQFSSCLVIKGGDVFLDGSVCLCPKCKTGTVYAGVKAYNCSNYRNPAIRCNFVIWRNLSGHCMKIKEVKDLCENRQTPLMVFKTKEGVEYERQLVLDQEGNVRFL